MAFGGGEIRLRKRIGWQLKGCIEGAGRKRRRRLVGERRESIGETVVEVIDHLVALAGLASHFDQQVDAHRRTEQQTVGRLVRFAGLPVERHDHRRVTREAKAHDASERGIDQAKAEALARADRLLLGDGAVDGHDIAEPAGHRRFHGVAEAAGDLPMRPQPPIGQDPEEVAIHRRRIRLLDDQSAGEPTSLLLQAVGVRVIPEGSSIRWRELVNEALTGRDGRLGEAGHTVHGVGQPDAVPMYGGFLVEAVLDDEAYCLALPHAECRPGNSAIVGPNRGRRTCAATERGFSWPGHQAKLGDCGMRRPGRQVSCRYQAANRQQQRPAG